MITRTKIIPEFYTYADYYGFTPEECLFFDIETTGLSSASASVFLIGILSYSGTEWTLTQWMSQNPQEECMLLQTFLSIAETKNTLIHFNGTTFDIPFIKERSRTWKLPPSSLSHFEEMQSVDLYQKLRVLKKLYNLERLTQQSLEQFCGWKRTDQLTGKHMIDLYKKYIASQEPLLADLLLLHNHDDLLGMIKLLPLTNVLMMNTSVVNDKKEITIVMNSKNHSLTFHFSLISSLPDSISKEGAIGKSGYKLNLSESSGTFTIQLLSDELKYFFSDYKNYYYLPAEDQAIHKSIGSFVDREYRQNAKPCNCYTRKTSTFLPQIRKKFQPEFQESYSDKLSYFELTDEFINNQASLIQYLDMMLPYIIFDK